MKLIGGLYFPTDENHFTVYGEKVADYQRPQRDKALTYVTDFTLAADVGAHCGIFSRHFAAHFTKVLAFEPMANLRDCLALNVPANVEIRPQAVSDRVGTCKMFGLSLRNSGCSFIYDDERVDQPDVQSGKYEPGNIVEVPLISIDSLELEHLGLLKVDVQGADHLVLAGAADTFRRCGTVVLAEEKPIGGPDGPVAHIKAMHEFMTSIGATSREKVGADRIFTFG